MGNDQVKARCLAFMAPYRLGAKWPGFYTLRGQPCPVCGRDVAVCVHDRAMIAYAAGTNWRFDEAKMK